MSWEKTVKIILTRFRPQLFKPVTFHSTKWISFAKHLKMNILLLYSRGLNPTVRILSQKLAALDGAEDCLVCH